MQQGLELVEDRLHEALDEVATLKAESAEKVLRSKKQPPSKVRFDRENYAVASSIISRRKYARLRAIAEAEGTTVSQMLRRFIDGKLQANDRQ